MIVLCAVILGITAVEMLLRLPILKSVRSVLSAAQNSVETIRSSEIPEAQKQQLLLKFAWSSFKNTCWLALQFIIWGALIAGLFWLLCRLFSLDLHLIYKPAFLAYATLASVVYGTLRKRLT